MPNDQNVSSEHQFGADVNAIALRCRDIALDLTLRNPLIKLPKPERSAKVLVLRNSDADITAKVLLTTNRSVLLFGSDCSKQEQESSKRSRNSQTGHLRLIVDMRTELLSARLARLRKQNEELIQKRGVPCGYAVSHALRWTTIDGQQCLAPLVLIPIDIRDELDSERLERRVVFTPSDRETIMNPGLFAYLRHHFKIDAPKLDEGEEISPEMIEAWIQRLEPICKARPGWKLEPLAAIGLFDCGAIPADCDPDNWNGMIGQSQTLTSVLLGTAKEAEQSKPTEFLPQTLVLEADGSQLQTLELASQGKNLVIHGPPGSGKSQTIVNLIAQALSFGRSVLFVAQKPEAAMVVHHRLTGLGLDAFCTSLMPVGSTSSSNLKQSVLQGLSRRVDIRRRPAGDDLQRRARLEQAVRLLESHASALRHVLPQFGRSAREIIAELALLREGKCDPFRRQELVEPSSPSDFAATTVALKHVVALRRDIPAEALDAIGGIGRIGTPSNPNAESQEFRDLVARMLEQLDKAASAIQRLRSIDVAVPSATLSETEQWAAGAPNLDVADDSNSIEFAARLHRPGGRDAFKRLEQAKQELRGIVATHPEARRRSQQLIEHDRHAWDSALKAISNTALDHVSSDATAQLGQALAAAERALRTTLLTGGASTSTEILHDAPDYAAWRGRITLLSQLEHGAAHGTCLCEAITRGSPNCTQIEQLIAATKQHQAAQLAAGRRLDIKKIPELQTLERIQAVLGCRVSLIARCWAMVTSKEYRLNRLAFKAMARLPIPRRDWDSEIKAAVELRESEAEVARQKGIWGQSPNANNIEALEAAHSWLVSLNRSVDAAKISLDQVWAMMRERRDPALEGAEKQTAVLCKGLLRENALLQAMNAIARTGHFRLRQFVTSLAEASRAALLGSNQAQAWKLPTDATLGGVLALGSAACNAREIESGLAADTDVKELVGADFLGIDTATARMEGVVSWHSAATEAERADWRSTIAKLLETPSTAAGRMSTLKSCTAEIAEATRSATAIAIEVESAFEMRGNAMALRLSASVSIDALISRCHRIQKHQAAIVKVFRHYASAVELRNRAGTGLVDKYLEGSVSCDRIAESYCASTYEHALRRDDSLAPLVDFDRKSIERALDELKELDSDLRKLNAGALIRRLAAAKIPEGVDIGRVRDKTDYGLVRHVVQTPKARLDLSGLYKRAGAAMRALQPCTIATPTTVSEYLPRQLASFDVVIIDEASQVEPASAIGSIVRGAQVIIVGDPKQLPPTNFFSGAQSSAEDEDGEEEPAGEEVADAESILDRAIAALTNVHLRGHYRSRHHSLIEWSNRNFYNSSLVVPPSTAPRSDQLGVIAKHVEGAFYSTSQNDVEAKTVAEAVVRHLRESPGESLGVVAFNVRQAELIEQHIIAIARQSREDFAAYARACESDTPLFVRSLESVQGDERDVIFISYTYGPDPTTKQVYQRFGPVLRQGGGRRLNVLVTRARNRVVVFHSMLPEQIVGDSGGAPLMRSYLHHAMRAPQHDFTEGDFESEFERQVANLIAQIDPCLVVKPQVGCDGFRIDLGVAHQSSPNRFLLGIECDGATYHSEPSARQRDMIRQAILEQHGWRIHRIWSTAWWHNFAEERSRLEGALKVASRQCHSEEG